MAHRKCLTTVPWNYQANKNHAPKITQTKISRNTKSRNFQNNAEWNVFKITPWQNPAKRPDHARHNILSIWAAGVAWWSGALTPSREGARSIPNPGNPFPTLGIGASPLFWDLAGRFCSILNMAWLVPKNRIPCKNWWRDSQNPIHKRKKIK